MVRNYLKIAWRNLLHNKVFSLINLLGLSIGIASCLLIFLFIMNEYSVDRFHKNGATIFRVMRNIEEENKSVPVAYLSGPYAPALLNDFKGQISRAVRVRQTNALVTSQNRSFYERKVIDADADFFQLFSFPLLRGNAATALTNPGSVVLTESTARKYFGSVDNAFGQLIKLDKNLPLKVTGIAQDVPTNSHLSFNLVVPLANYKADLYMTQWINNALFTYVQLAPSASLAQVERSLPGFMQKYMGPVMKQFGFRFALSLTPMDNIYFEQGSFDNLKHGDKKVVYLFLSIAALILLVACINFMNLSTVRAMERSREIGVRKVLGAVKQHLVWQFIGESVLLTTLSCVLAVGLVALALPAYAQLLGQPIQPTAYALPITLFLIGIIVVTGFLAGSYPAFVLAAFSPIQALKGKLRLGRGSTSFRQVLVVIQFSISIVLMLGMAIVTRQLHYLKHKELGYNSAQTMVIPIENEDIYNFLTQRKGDLLGQSQVSNVSLMSGEPGGYFDAQMFDVEGRDERWRGRTEFVDFDYVKTLDLKLIAGRDLSPAFATDSTQALLLNRTAVGKLGWTPQQAIGKWLRNTVRDSTRRKVVGVVEDFNYLSLREQIEPLVIAPSDDQRVGLIRLKPGDVQAGVEAVTALYAKTKPAYPFDYRFLDEQFDQTYQADLRQQTILGVFAGLAIFIACLGLFGLASFLARQRTKEIGVRKVLGASVVSVVALLSKDFLKLVLVAIVIASPLAYYGMNRWLQSFAYRVEVSWWVFVLAGLVAIGVALLTISVQSVRAALANPVKSLRSE